MKRILNINDVLITDDSMRDIIEIFPNIENKFRKRKEFYEYYFDGAEVELTIDIIDKLNELGFKVIINWEIITLH